MFTCVYAHRQTVRSLVFGGALLAALLALISWTSGPALRTATIQAQESTIRFAVIGDFGKAGPNAESVADLVKSWQPALIATVGDNNYERGAAETMDANIGQYYHEYIYPYRGVYGSGSPGENRFFPVLGNHDWGARGSIAITCTGMDCAGPYFDYFDLPGNERTYDFVAGPVHFFMLSSDGHEPAGRKATSPQAEWLQEGVEASIAPWQLVFLHHPPYSSGDDHGSTANLQWPYGEWGVDAVLAGHDHHYERLVVDGLLYFVNGAGGKGIRPEVTPISGSLAIYTTTFGALLVEASAISLTFQYFDIDHTLVDSYTLTQTATITSTHAQTPTNTATWTATPAATATSTPTPRPTNTPTPTPTATATGAPDGAGSRRQFLPVIRG